MNKKTFLIVFALFLIGFFLRVFYLNNAALTFFYDQARDGFVVQQIIEGNIKIQGPSANAPGLNHGVFYYYFLVVPYLLSNGDPLFATYWLALFNSATIFIVYFLCFKLTKNRNAAILAATFFTFSFKISQYATWLSNPSMAIWFVPLIYLFLWFWTKKSGIWNSLLTGVFLGLSVQSDLFLVYHGIAILVWLFVNRLKVVRKDVLSFLVGAILGASTLIISEIKFGFQGLKGITYLFSGGDQIVKTKGLGDFLVIYLNQLGSTIALNIFPLSMGFGGFLGLAMIVWLVFSYLKRTINESESWELFLLIYIFSHLPVVFFGGLSSSYLTVGIDVAICILAGVVVSLVWENYKSLAVIFTLVVVLSGVNKIVNENKLGQTIFSTRNEMLLSSLEQVVDYTYESSNGDKFSINTITAPLWMNTTWSYVYNWYGVKKYGFLPFWHGRNQIGSLGNNLVDTPPGVPTYYLIKEPEAGIPQRFINESLDEENSKSRIVEEKNFNGIIVQKRIPFK